MAALSYREFKGTCIAAIAEVGAALVPQRRMRFDDHVIRKLRMTMVITPMTRASLGEALRLVVGQIAERTTRARIRFGDVEELLAAPTSQEQGEAEWEPTPVAAEWLRGVRRIVTRIRRDGITYWVVDWQPTGEVRANIPVHMIAPFERQNRAIVRRAYFEDQAEEA